MTCPRSHSGYTRDVNPELSHGLKQGQREEVQDTETEAAGRPRFRPPELG